MASKKSIASGGSVVETVSTHNVNAGAAVSIDIRGARGPNAVNEINLLMFTLTYLTLLCIVKVTINGIYDPTDEICNDWPVYQKRGDANKVLRLSLPRSYLTFLCCSGWSFSIRAISGTSKLPMIGNSNTRCHSPLQYVDNEHVQRQSERMDALE